MNVGQAVLSDLQLLGITSIQQLALADPDAMIIALQKITKSKQNPCVLDVFRAIVHEARTGEKTPWWQWSCLRKKTKFLR